VLSHFLVSLFDHQIAGMCDSPISVHCSIDIIYWSLEIEFLGAKSKSGYHCMVDEILCCS